MKQTFQEQNDVLFENLLNAAFYSKWKLPLEQQGKEKLLRYPSFLELYISPECNKKCSYCYLQKNKDDLYPKDIRDKQQILHNLDMLFDYYNRMGLTFDRVDLFSGEIWGYPFSLQVFDILLKYIQKGVQINEILIPTNGSFCASKSLMQIMDNYIAKFSDVNTELKFSLSYDGIVLDEIERPFINSKDKYDDEYIDNLFTFAKNNHFGFHPMISSYSIEKQIENYDKWIEMIDHYYPEEKERVKLYNLIMQLEVRDHTWTEEKIIEYLKWLRHYIETDFKYFFQEDVEWFINRGIFGIVNPDTRATDQAYFPYRVDYRGHDLGCGLGDSLVIRLGDLSIVPCHRTSYKKMVLGQYVVENDQIVKAKCNNFPLANAIYMTSFSSKPFCATCPINNYCIKSCLGANYEYNNELFAPSEQNCELQKAKIIFLYHYYRKHFNLTNYNNLNKAYNAIIEQEPEVYNKWNFIIQQLI